MAAEPAGTGDRGSGAFPPKPSEHMRGVIVVIHPIVQEATKKCSNCGLEMGETSPLAEHLYWQSDAFEGLICLCAPCARNILGQGLANDTSMSGRSKSLVM